MNKAESSKQLSERLPTEEIQRDKREL